MTGVRVIIENRAPANGTWLTPVWVGLHNGGFDVYDDGSAASEALERLAEDGNAQPLSDAFLASGQGTVQGTVPSDVGIPQIAPGETVSMTLIVDETDPNSRFFSYASMVIPSNDAFIGNDDPTDHQLFDINGNFLGAFITIYGTDVRDAGTEVNDEIPAHTAFFGQTEPDTGVDEFGVVHDHPGFLPPGSGGILDDPMFANADFTQPGYEIARIIIIRSDTPVPSGAVSGVWTAEDSPYLISGDVVVLAGDTLVMEPGTHVVFLCQCRMFVEGNLQADGTPARPVVFTRDPAISGWGGLRFFYSEGISLLRYCRIEYGDNHLLNNPFNLGAGIHCQNSAVHVDQSLFKLNLAVSGGAIYSDECDLVVSDSEFIHNIADGGTGGAIAVIGYNEPVLVGNVITENFAKSGAGISCADADALISDNVITDNECYDNNIFGPATASGGGIFLRDDANALVIGNLIAGNSVVAEGNAGSSARGGGIRCFQADPILINNTFANNLADGFFITDKEGGALAAYNAYPTLVNNILWNDVPQEVHIDNFSTNIGVKISYSDVQGGLAEILIESGIVEWLEGNIDADPLFTDPIAGDYSLGPASPCIDAGDPSTPPDADGTVADIGALPLLQTPLADFDTDGDVDLDDYAIYHICAAGPGVVTPPAGCTAQQFAAADLDGDLDVDLADFGWLTEMFGASVNPGPPGACCQRGLCYEAPSQAACTNRGGVFHGPGTTCPETACDFWEYRCETDFTVEAYRPGAGVGIADDITLVGSGLRELTYYDLLVYAFEGEPYDVTVELWDGCPGDGGTAIPGTGRTWTDLPLNILTPISAEFDNIPIPETVWMVVTLSTNEAGWFVVGQPQAGFTDDFYAEDQNPWNCTQTLASGSYAGFWARIRCE
ncbi:MAG: spondin domain-containing protein [Planctomycetota bacterium]